VGHNVSQQQKTIALLFFGITLIGLIVLAAGLSRLELQPGERFSLPTSAPVDIADTEGTGWVDTVLLIVRVTLGLSLLVMPLYIAYLIIFRHARRDLVLLLSQIAIMAALLLLFMRVSMTKQLEEELEAEIGGGWGEEILPAPPLAEFIANPPNWVVDIVGIVLALVITGIVATFLLNRKARTDAPGSISRLAEEAEEAIQDLYAGKDLRQTIIRCYHDMSLVLVREQAITRSSGMTTQEFELILKEKGLPEQPVHELTSLFEDVRYGDISPGEIEETRAIASLSAIVAAIRRDK
jgi:hypothetical protein